MPADPKPPLGATPKFQWLGWLPGTLSLPGLSFVYGVAQENCPGRVPKPGNPPAASGKGCLRGERVKGSVDRGC